MPGNIKASHWPRFDYASAMLIQTHAHLDYPDFEQVLRRPTDAGVTRIISIGDIFEQHLDEAAELSRNVSIHQCDSWDGIQGTCPLRAGLIVDDLLPRSGKIFASRKSND